MKNSSRTPNADVIAHYSDEHYDTDAMRTDDAHGNFSPERAEEYRTEYIVQESIANGQFRQARQQCLQYGLIYEQQMVIAGLDPWK